jgi:cell fate (sporulation/competence/biofilm development) regulator YlbF (YheA/YmcA/DUF963 family)
MNRVERPDLARRPSDPARWREPRAPRGRSTTTEESDAMTIEEKAVELGRLIGQSPEYQAVKRSNDALNADREAVTLLQQMEQVRVEAQRMIERGENPTPEMEQQLDDLLGRVQTNTAYQRAVAAQENFDKVMLRVNDQILDGIRRGATSSIITLA